MDKKINLSRALIRPRTADEFHRALKLQRSIRGKEDIADELVDDGLPPAQRDRFSLKMPVTIDGKDLVREVLPQLPTGLPKPE